MYIQFIVLRRNNSSAFENVPDLAPDEVVQPMFASLPSHAFISAGTTCVGIIPKQTMASTPRRNPLRKRLPPKQFLPDGTKRVKYSFCDDGKIEAAVMEKDFALVINSDRILPDVETFRRVKYILENPVYVLERYDFTTERIELRLEQLTFCWRYRELFADELFKQCVANKAYTRSNIYILCMVKLSVKLITDLEGWRSLLKFYHQQAYVVLRTKYNTKDLFVNGTSFVENFFIEENKLYDSYVESFEKRRRELIEWISQTSVRLGSEVAYLQDRDNGLFCVAKNFNVLNMF